MTEAKLVPELNKIAKVTPVNEPEVMSRNDKLHRWARLVAEHHHPLVLFSNLEHWNAHMLAFREPGLLAMLTASPLETPFHLAANDPVFKAAGLEDNSPAASMKFFDLTQDQLHEFSCDCGGLIRNDEMARRIERLAV